MKQVQADKPKRKWLKWVLGFLVVSAVYGAIFGDKPEEDKQVDSTNSTVEQVVQNEATQLTEQAEQAKVEYDIVNSEVKPTVENLWVLVKPGTNAEVVATEVKKTCSRACNISIYDDQKAYELDYQYTQLDSSEAMTAWKEKYYVFVADHLVGSVNFGSGVYSEYPYRDWYYEELSSSQ